MNNSSFSLNGNEPFSSFFRGKHCGYYYKPLDVGYGFTLYFTNYGDKPVYDIDTIVKDGKGRIIIRKFIPRVKTDENILVGTIELDEKSGIQESIEITITFDEGALKNFYNKIMHKETKIILNFNLKIVE